MPLAYATQGGELRLEPKYDLLNSLGLAVQGAPAPQLHLQLLPEAPLIIELGDGAPTGLRTGSLAVPALQLRRTDGQRSPQLSLQPEVERALGMDLVDPFGAVWLRLGQAMRSPDPAQGFRIVTADLRVGPALAAWTETDSEGLLFGRAELDLPLGLPPAVGLLASAKSCAFPDWSTGGFEVDVRLTNIDKITSLRCRPPGTTPEFCSGMHAFSCDGPGGSDGEVVWVPDATLRNSDVALSADVPWYRKFSGEFAPHGNDQHPYLVWNLYRLDADGSLLQIARSGLKHAFATANNDCSDTSCQRNGHILGRGCSDLYDAGSNDSPNALAPRREVIPATGQWGRCGSLFDNTVNASGEPGCDEIQDFAFIPPGEDCYRFRMVARESDIDPAEHPGARWFIDAWYVVRDDVDIFNSMGWREVHPTWRGDATPQRWIPESPGPFVQGSLLDYWHEQTSVAAQSTRTLLETADGTVLLVTRVEAVEGGHRYRYALMNLDWARVETAGAEPNLQILEHSGFSAMRLDVAGHSVASAAQAVDGARGSGQWQSRSGCAGPAIEAPEGAAELQWGELMRFDVVSQHPPVLGQLLLQPAEGASPIALDAPVPDARTIFCAPFE